ncbi:MAG TPA: cupin domain-containing protein [Thermodesulfobacteriota bacterium]|nr:cupin domain-containing protein [Thermodesulfobacteriota bacterium]
MKEKLKMANIINEKDLVWDTNSYNSRFEYKKKSLSQNSGAEKLGCSIYEVPPGKSAFPFHYHCSNEEAVFILEGNAELRFGDESYFVSKGDYLTFPAEGSAHQLTNRGETTLKYICISTMVEPDIKVYPDSGKVGVVSTASNNGTANSGKTEKFLRGDVEVVGLWEGE